jgi:hypothetical protein
LEYLALLKALEKLKNRFQYIIEIIVLKPRVTTNVGWPSGGHDRFASRFWNVPK